MSDPYEAEKRGLRVQIAQLTTLRDAQVPDSAHQRRFQRQINTLTDQLLGWEDNAGQLAAADVAIARAKRRVYIARNAVHDAGRIWSYTAAASGALGGIMLLSSLLWSTPLWVPMAAIVGMLGAVACIVLAMRSRRDALLDLTFTRRKLAEAENARDALIPS